MGYFLLEAVRIRGNKRWFLERMGGRRGTTFPHPRLICLGLKAANKIAFRSTSDEARQRYSDGVGAALQLIQAVGVVGTLSDVIPRYLASSLSYSSALTTDLREIAIKISSGVVSG